ncbi:MULTISPECIES: hypothetical protein [Bacillus amyloliquefaciens group]|uniref:hypothetical protein n=1 Tax=Bacillus amyloliquefaciens group TaxID=1938374 RepID=UPI0002059758|nr:hypothetical protein [Bacillus amyloliquefaciens]AEB23456.1 hypothetical protein BAMTA208_06405 [Bacillus amyloliquefaciens TA208]AEK88459.1 hypothetical protein BAXH7_01321 [Bacillus amyloliquefaciens XH7]MEC0967127.1 hypothetical protein [Bacillus amyloliquefaciens]MEC1832796.1 hypothetical protein [Bacillus amyloliquefaciens]MEC1836301.1 hypothetical protein [Bacillus amyloliquefaciens]
MGYEEIQKQYEFNKLESDAFKRGYKEGVKRAEHIRRRNKNMETLLYLSNVRL